MSKLVYDDNSISQLKGAERVRKRPEALLGSKGIDGAIHTVQEIIGNATDEKLAGYGSKLDIHYHNDGSISVRDYGRGVPLGWNEKEQNWNYLLIYSELYAGGKYSDNQEILRRIEKDEGWETFKITDYPYLISVGLNGLGGACTQYTSSFFDVISYRDGVSSEMHFKKGEPCLDELIIKDTKEPNGTYIHWKPDDEVFTSVDIPDKWFENTAKSLAFVAGFEVNLNIRGNVRTYSASNLSEEMKESVGNCLYSHDFKKIIDGFNDICICDLEVAVGPGGRHSDYYHNKVGVRGGAHSTGVARALQGFFYELGNRIGIKINERDYAGKLSFIVSTLANKASMRNQTKDSIDDDWIGAFIGNIIYNVLTEAYTKSTPWLLKVVDQVIEDAKNRIAVAEMSKSLREVQKLTKSHKASSKFVSCRSYEEKRVGETEFFIVEGDSAGGNVVNARNSDYQCLLKIRGKSLNVFKAPLQKLIANKEILDMISILGCGVDMGIDDFESFNMDNLKVGKIIFCSDADVDGRHIRQLLFVIFYKLFRPLLYSGNIYVAETPLYVINRRDAEPIYCMDNNELEEMQSKIDSSSILSIDRFKGLGECDPEILWSTTLNPATRKLRQIKIDPEDTDVYDALDILFGKVTDNRKRAILGSMLGTDFDSTIDNIEDMINYIDSLDLNNDLDIEEVDY